MNKKNNKGFTLVVVLAVTIILIVIIFIAFNKIKSSTHKAKMNSFKSSALSYRKAVLSKISQDIFESESLDTGYFTVSKLSEYNVTVNGQMPTGGFVLVSDSKIIYSCLEYEKSYSVIMKSNGDVDVNHEKCELAQTWTFNYTGEAQTFRTTKAGYYLFELWGAQGGSNNSAQGGKGAYTSGVIQLDANQEMYVFVGGVGSSVYYNEPRAGGYNGGGQAYGQSYGSRNWGSGGGATDIRLVNGDWNNELSLNSRIMVAAGGGGAYYDGGNYHGGAAGGFTGLIGAQWSSDSYCYGEGGTQTSGGRITTNCNRSSSYNNALTGSFGKGGDCPGSCAGGGGGYYGGSRSGHVASAGGGSSYISGHTGCVAITSSTNQAPRQGCQDGTTDYACSLHYSEYVFVNTVMLAGNEDMPSHNGLNTITGNTGNGYAKITLIY